METRKALGQDVGGEDRIAGILKDIVPREMFARTMEAIVDAVAASYKQDQIWRAPTRDENKRRGEICMHGIADMVTGLDWPLPRALDHVTKHLRETLDGGDFVARCKSRGVLWPENESQALDPRVRDLVR
jgi:hypothetical protein